MIIHVLDKKTEQIVATLENKNGYPALFWDDRHIEKEENSFNTYEFTTIDDGKNPAAEYLIVKNKIVIRDLDGYFIPFTIEETEQDSSGGQRVKRIYAEGEHMELRTTKIIEPTELIGATLNTALDYGLQGTRWKRGITEFAGARDIKITEYITALAFLNKIASEFNVQLRFRVEIDGNQIVGRYVDALVTEDIFDGKEITFGKDVIGIRRIENSSEVYTALYAIGPADENGKYVTIEQINGGKKYVEDREALERWSPDGRHLFGIYQYQSDGDEKVTPELLKQKAQEALKNYINSVVKYEAQAVALERIAGLEHEKIRKGMTVRIKDEKFNPPLYLEARVLETERSYTAKDRDMFVLGNYREIQVVKDATIAQIQSKLFRNENAWSSSARVIRSATPPEDTHAIWIDITKTPEVPMTYDFTTGQWKKASPTVAEEIGAETPTGAQQKAETAKQEAMEYADQAASTAEQNAKQYTEEYTQQHAEQKTPDVIPAVPANFTATGSFKKVILNWDIDTSKAISHYELYGSQTAGFTPDITNLLWKGKQSSFIHEADVNQTWYYRLRAINAYGKAGEFTQEVSATTAKIISDDILFGAVNAQHIADLAITAEKLADGSITMPKIEDFAVDASKLADGSVIQSKIADLAITNEKITNNAVNNAKLADLAVTAAKLASGAVTNDKIANSAVDNAKLANLAVDAAKLQNGIIDNTKLADLAVTAQKLADGSITTPKVADGAINTAKIVDDAITQAKIAAGAVGNAELDRSSANKIQIATNDIINNAITNLKIASNAVDSSKLADLAVTAAKLASGSVDNSKITSGAVDNSKLANLAVDAAKLADDAVTNAKIADNAVDSAQIKDAAIINAKIANLAVGTGAIQDGAITNAKIANAAIDSAKIANAAITSAHIANAAVGAAAIANAAIGTAHIADGSITNAKIANAAIDSAKISRIYANKIAVADFTNLVAWDIENNPSNTVVTINNVKYYKVGPSAYAKLSFTDSTKVEFKVGDEYYFALYGYKDAAIPSITFIIRYYYTDGSWSNAGTATAPFTTTEGLVSGVCKITSAPTAGKTVSKVDFFMEKSNETTGYYYARDLELRKRQQGELIVDGAITAQKIAAGAITAGSAIIADGAITSAKIATAAIGTVAIQDGAITNAKIQNAAIGTAAIQDGAITNAKIAVAAIGTAEIQDAAITSAKIANLAVGTAAIQDGAITNAKIANLDASKITSGYIDANRIAANTITTDKLVVADLTNLCVNPVFDGGSNKEWSGVTAVVNTTTGVPANAPTTYVGKQSQRDGYCGSFFPVNEGDKFYIEVWCATSNSTQKFGAGLQFQKEDGALTWVRGFQTTPIGTWTKFSGEVTVPTGYTKARVWTQIEATSNFGDWYFTKVVVRRKANSELIVDGAITAQKIAAGAITAGSAIIADGAIGTAKIADASITSAKIASLAVGNAAIQNAAITNAKIATAAIGTAQIQDAAITNAKIADLAVDSSKIADASITTAKIADAAITSAKIANAAITSAHIQNAAIGNAAIANASITAAKIANLAVGTAQIQDAAITNAKIANLAVDNAKIANLHGSKITAGSITADKLSVTSLSAISANLGTVTAGTLKGLTAEDLYIGSYGAKIDTSQLPDGTNAVRLQATSSSYIRSNADDSFSVVLKNENSFHFDLVSTYNDRRIKMGNVHLKGLNGAGRVGLEIRDVNDAGYEDLKAKNITATGGLIADRVSGQQDANVVLLGNNTQKIDNSNGDARWKQSDGNYIFQGANGDVRIYVGGVVKHAFYANGTKSGGSIEIDGINWGMSPIDSPRVMIADLITDVQLNELGVVVRLDERLAKAFSRFAIFPNNPTARVVEKGTDYFVVTGEGIADFYVLGIRIDQDDKYFENLTILEEIS
ncbi:DNA-directed RNA polymerase subunit omega [Parageobacillus genomosp. 1]|uniref:DNA-directed RNA polymerase subunit omega n=1 Tax=Parageobacillus genomosp. 1 TaxID=1295642 RepID=A0ABC9VA73_9BACL|nr:phage tail spike protein [Parageobacillus genomosp. 1]EZP74999.1 DNA-directed RNA polymerase subunit omega [Parageobacillus genomosp. 1]